MSDPHDGPRGLQHPGLRPEQRQTWASLRFRGNKHMAQSLEDEGHAPIDIDDLTSLDLCA